MGKYNQVINYVDMKLKSNNNGHDISHALRVERYARRICDEIDVKVNTELCIIASLVHDLIDHKVASDQNIAKSELEQFLLGIGYDKSFVLDVILICDTISYSKGLELSSKEAMVVQDADRLDALGLIGAVRTIAYSTSVNRPLYIPGDISDDTAIGHFHNKLYKLKDLMNYEQSKQIAVKKEKALRQFEKQYINELEGVDD